jgi:hypothetical protein
MTQASRDATSRAVTCGGVVHRFSDTNGNFLHLVQNIGWNPYAAIRYWR